MKNLFDSSYKCKVSNHLARKACSGLITATCTCLFGNDTKSKLHSVYNAKPVNI